MKISIFWYRRDLRLEDNTGLFEALNENENDWNDFESILKALEKFIRIGKIRYIGMSNETPYGLSKYLTSNLIKNFCLAERIYFKDLRIFSVFGEWEQTDRLVAGAIDSAINKKFFFIKTVNQFRDYLHTDDVVSAICLLYTSPSPRDRQKSRMPSSA